MEDNLKKQWQETKFDNRADYIQSIIDGRRRTALQNLASRYKRFSIIATVMIVLCPVMLGLSDILPDSTPKWIVLAFMSIYFLTCSIMDNWLHEGIKSIDCITMTVAEVTRKAAYYRSRHLKFMLILIPMAVLILGGLAYVATSDRYFILGMTTGALIALALGSRQFLRFMADYRDLSR